jgi:hypothetical protein
MKKSRFFKKNLIVNIIILTFFVFFVLAISQSKPSISTPSGCNLTTENITAQGTGCSEAGCKSIYNWYRNNKSDMVLNLQFEENHHNLSKNSDYAVGNWWFEKNSTDYSGAGSHGTLYGGNVTNATGIIGYGYDFNSSTVSCMSATLGSELNASKPGSNGYTLSLWAKRREVNPSGDTVAGRVATFSGADSLRAYGTSAGDGRFAWQIFYGAGCNQECTSTSYAVNSTNWHHLTGTFDGTTARFYIDGAQRCSFNARCAQNQSETVLRISSRYCDTEAFNGTIDEVTIWNRSLSANEIKQLYNGYAHIKDYSGNIKNGINNSGLSYNLTAGYDRKGAYSFDGKNDYISVEASTNSLDLEGEEEITMALWVKVNTRTGTYPRLAGRTGVWDISSGLNDGKFCGAVNDEVGWRSGICPALTNGLWYHIAVTLNGSQMRTYHNGQLVNVTRYGTIDSSAGDLAIGAYSTAQYFFNGTIDEFTIWNRSLSANEIRDIYQNKTNMFNALNTNVGDLIKAQVWASKNGFISLPQNTSEMKILSSCPPTPVNVTLVTLIRPINKTKTYANHINFTFQAIGSAISNCSLFLNNTLNSTDTSITLNIDQTFNITIKNGKQNWKVGCYSIASLQYNSTIWEINPVEPNTNDDWTLALVLIFSAISIFFAYLSINLDKQHIFLKWSFFILSLLSLALLVSILNNIIAFLPVIPDLIMNQDALNKISTNISQFYIIIGVLIIIIFFYIMIQFTKSVYNLFKIK